MAEQSANLDSKSFGPRGFGPKAHAALNDVVGGSAASVLNITFGLSYALLIFAGPLTPYLSYGVAATFISSAVLATVIALGSSFPFAIAAPESSTAAMTGILASSLVERMTALHAAAEKARRADPPATRMSFRVELSNILGKTPAAGQQRPAGHGTPAEVAADLMRYREAAGLDAFQINFHGNRDLSQLLDSMECFMRDVVPQVS